MLQLETVDFSGRHPLHAAAAGGHLAAVQKILGINPWHSMVDYNGVTPLHEAAKNGHVPVIHQLLFSGASVASVDAYGSASRFLRALRVSF